MTSMAAITTSSEQHARLSVSITATTAKPLLVLPAHVCTVSRSLTRCSRSSGRSSPDAASACDSASIVISPLEFTSTYNRQQPGHAQEEWINH